MGSLTEIGRRWTGCCNFFDDKIIVGDLDIDAIPHLTLTNIVTDFSMLFEFFIHLRARVCVCVF